MEICFLFALVLFHFLNAFDTFRYVVPYSFFFPQIIGIL